MRMASCHPSQPHKAHGKCRLCYAKACAKARYASSPEVVKTKAKSWRKANPEHILTYNKAWRAENREQFRAQAKVSGHRRRAQLLEATVEPLTVAELDAHVASLGGRCVYCNGPYEHLDHVYPLSKGGPHALNNLVPSCADCNLRKHNQLPLQWLGLV